MKQILVIALVLFGLTASATTPPEITEKVLKAFRETFTNATDVVWHESGAQYQANFKQADITARATYDAEGNLLSTVRYYYEQNLPAHILAKLKRKYADRSIFGVTEITTENEISYYIKLEDEKNWYTIKSDVMGYFELKEKYKKA